MVVCKMRKEAQVESSTGKRGSTVPCKSLLPGPCRAAARPISAARANPGALGGRGLQRLFQPFQHMQTVFYTTADPLSRQPCFPTSTAGRHIGEQTGIRSTSPLPSLARDRSPVGWDGRRRRHGAQQALAVRGAQPRGADGGVRRGARQHGAPGRRRAAQRVAGPVGRRLRGDVRPGALARADLRPRRPLGRRHVQDQQDAHPRVHGRRDGRRLPAAHHRLHPLPLLQGHRGRHQRRRQP